MRRLDGELQTLLARDVEKQERLRVLLHIDTYFDVSPAVYWKQLRFVWTTSESLYSDAAILGEAFARHSADSGFLMNPGERVKLRRMPDTLKVWRGGSPLNRHGWSWTLDSDVADFFARRACTADDSPGEVYQGEVGKDDVVGYLTERNESEVIAPPWSVDVTSVKRLDGTDMNQGRYMYWAAQTGNLFKDVSIPMMLPSDPTAADQFRAIVKAKSERLRRFGLIELADKVLTDLDAAIQFPYDGADLGTPQHEGLNL